MNVYLSIFCSVCMCVSMCVTTVCACMNAIVLALACFLEAKQGQLCIRFYHSLPYSFETGSPSEPGPGLASSKPAEILLSPPTMVLGL